MSVNADRFYEILDFDVVLNPEEVYLDVALDTRPRFADSPINDCLLQERYTADLAIDMSVGDTIDDPVAHDLELSIRRTTLLLEQPGSIRPLLTKPMFGLELSRDTILDLTAEAPARQHTTSMALGLIKNRTL